MAAPELMHLVDVRVAGALDGVSLSIRAGELLMVVGANGSGKSTLARLLVGIIEPTSGRVLVNDALPVGFVQQDPASQLIGATVADDVAFGLERSGAAPDQIRDRVASALHRVGLTDLAWRDPRELSGGQQQRVAIAGAIVLGAHLYVLDEPTSQLDAESRLQVLQLAQELCALGACVVWVTQLPEELHAATRVVALQDGHVVYDGSPRALAAVPLEAARVGVGLPPVSRIANELVELGVWDGSIPLTLEEVLR